MMRGDWHLSWSLAALAACAAGGGGEEQFVATFTSDVVQRNTCRILGTDNDRELCVRDESISRFRVDIIEDEFDRAWIIGVPRDGASDRRMLGTRDAQDGWLFIEETRQTNEATLCALESRVELSLWVDEDADPEVVGVDPCIALLGRETRTLKTSKECDTVNDPPVEITRITRRRWERAIDCRPAAETADTTDTTDPASTGGS